MNEASRLVSLAALALAVACTPQKPTETDAAPSAVPVAPLDAAPSSSAAPMDAHAHMEHWEEARASALRIPCRAIAVDGPVRVEGSGDAGGPLPFQGEIPDETWLTLGKDARLVAKDPRTTRETTFVGPARVRACVAHREESWLVAGRFESAIGAGETPGAEEWVVTPLGVVRYMAAKVAVEVRARDTAVGVGSGPAFMWLDAGVRVTRARGASATDAGALAEAGVGPTVDDDGWLRMAEGEVTLSPGPARSPRRRRPRDRRRMRRARDARPGARRGAPGRKGHRGRHHGKRADADPPPRARRVRGRRAACGHLAPIDSEERAVDPAAGRGLRMGRSSRAPRRALTAVDMLDAVPLASLKGA